MYFFSEYDLHVLPGVKQPPWGVGEIFSFFPLIFFVGWGQGRALKFYSSGIVGGTYFTWLQLNIGLEQVKNP